MLPIKDDAPLSGTPWMTWTIIFLNTLFFLYTLSLYPYSREVFFHLYGLIPIRLTNPDFAEWLGFPHGAGLAVFTHMFLHGGWIHFLGNMWSMWIFADNVEDMMGSFRFLVFYVLCGLGALSAHLLFNYDSTVPIIGASGAIAGVMGAYFVLFPRAKVLTMIFFPLFIQLPAYIFLGLWFVMNVFSGLGSTLYEGGASPIAWWAHAGGFVVGILLRPYFTRKTSQEIYYYED